MPNRSGTAREERGTGVRTVYVRFYRGEFSLPPRGAYDTERDTGHSPQFPAETIAAAETDRQNRNRFGHAGKIDFPRNGTTRFFLCHAAAAPGPVTELGISAGKEPAAYVPTHSLRGDIPSTARRCRERSVPASARQ